MATVATNPPPPAEAAAQPAELLSLEALRLIDITTLSQSELHALSLCSPSAFNLHNPSHLPPPKIDRSLFNESVGSRRQTYSRPSTTTTTPATTTTAHRRRVAGLLPTPKLPPIPENDPERMENHSIITHLKHFLNQDPQFDQFDLTLTSFPLILSSNPTQDVENETVRLNGDRKRKRGRKPKVKVLNVMEEGYGYGYGYGYGNGRGVMEIVNKNGVVVDLSVLGNADEPYGEELRRRTEGMGSEEELLGFMRELGGQWGSRRKKRKIVDATVFGDAFPVGWKLLLGIKRRDGRASIYCRRYISPTGQQFVSCKEAALYLQSFFGLGDAQWPIGQKRENIQKDYTVTSENHAGYTQKDEDQRQDIIPCSTPPRVPISNDREREAALLGMENLADVQIRDLFECHKCSMTFDEKDSYLQHLLSFHQRTTRRYRLGSSVGDGVIIKDGKYECQFCHKVFLERRRYNGHVGIHVRNYVRRVEEMPAPTTIQKRIESPTRDDVPSRISKMDALIEIAQNSIRESSAVGPNDEPNGVSTLEKLNISTQEIPAAKSDRQHNFHSPVSGQEMDNGMTDRTLDRDLNQQDGEHMITAGNIEKIDDANKVVVCKMDSCLDAATMLSAKEPNFNTSEAFCGKDGLAFTDSENEKSGTEQEGASEIHLHAPLSNQIICDGDNTINLGSTSTLEHPKPSEVRNNKISELKISFGGSNDGPANNIAMETVQKSEENVLQHGVSDSSTSPERSLHYLSTINEISDKGEEQICSADQRHENVTGFEELRLDEIEPLKYSSATGQESLSLQAVPMDLTYNAEMEGVYGSSVQFESEEVMFNMAGRHQLTTVCVWCGIEFNHEAVGSEIQSDSVGFMCPICKAKISGQLNVLDGGSPMDSHHL